MEKVMRMYCISRKLYLNNIPILPKIFSRLIRFIFSAEIPHTCQIDESVQLKHGGLGIVIHDKTIIGANSVIYQKVTLAGLEGGYPIIGKNCLIGTGAVVLGNVKIGDGAKIGANAVVLSNVPAGATAVGVPARLILKE